MNPYTDLIGQKFGRLTVRSYVKGSRWECVCECGVIHIAVGYDLKRGVTQSCGCLGIDRRREATSTHGKTNTPEYKTWANMHQRCGNPKNRMYYRYGGRGIKVCARWEKFEHFLEDMGVKPTPNHTIDRVDSNGNYEPANCCWLPKAEQSANRTNVIRFQGKTVAEWAEELGVPKHTMYQRIRRNPHLFIEGDSDATP